MVFKVRADTRMQSRYVVLVKSCCQSKHTAAHLSTSQKMPPQVLPRQKMPKTTFSQPYITIHVYEKD